MRKTVFSLLVLACSYGAAAFAEDAVEPESPWSGSVSFGYLSSTGNTEDTSALLTFDVAYTVKPWEHKLMGRGYGASKDSATTAEAYKAGWKSTYDFSEFNYSFGALDWNKDRFAGYTRQTFATVGYGRRILNNETYVLNAEIGVGYAKQRAAATDVLPAITEDGASGTLGGDFTWNFSDTASFEQTLYIFTTSDNNFWESVSQVKAALVGDWSLAVSYKIKQNSDVPAGTEKKDTLTSIALDYSF